MKKAISLVLSVMLVISMFAGLNITVYAEEPTVQNTTFPYNNADTYVADSIIRGVIDKEGVAHGSSETSLALLHNYTYRNIAEELVDDGALMFDSLFWQNLKSTLSGDFVNITNWQEEMYILLIIDYLNYYSESAEFESNYLKNTFKFTENIYKNVIKYADSEYLDNVDEIIKNQSLSDAVAFSNKWGIVDDLKKYNSILGDIETVSSTATDYYKNLTKALSVQKADESRIEFLKQMKKAGSDNYYFVTAVDNVISMYESSYGSLAFSQGAKTMLKHGMSVLFSEAKKACPEAAAIIDGLKIYNEGLNWLFNSDDISKNNLKLVIVYTIGSYASSAMRSLRDTFQVNPTEDNASAFINGYLGYLKYQEYASNNTIGFVSSALFDGVVNQIINCFSDKNTLTYNEFKEYFHNDISFCESLEKLVQKHYDLYYAILSYDPSAITDDDPQDNLTEVDPNTATSDDTDLSDILYQLMISGNTIISKDYTLTNDLTIYGDLYFKGGTLDLDGHTLFVGGDVIQSGGQMYVHEGTLEIGGDYRLQTYQYNKTYDKMEYVYSSGILKMNDTNDRVKINGDYITAGYDAILVAGTMIIGGDITQIGTSSYYDDNFACSGSHKVILNGSKQQHISFDSSYAGFSDLETINTDVVFDTKIKGWTLKRDTTFGNGLEKGMFGTFDLDGYKLTINGSIYQSGGLIYINKGEMVVTGDYRIQTYEYNQTYDRMDFGSSSGMLKMDSVKDNVIINGDFVTAGYDTTLSAGTMTISGDITQIGTSSYYDDNFVCSGSHKVILNGSKQQHISFDSSYAGFSDLETINTDVVFDTKIKGWTLKRDTVLGNGLEKGLNGTFDLNGHKLTVDGNLYQSSGEMKINQGTLEVTGDYRIQTYEYNQTYDRMEFGTSSGKLKMDSVKDNVIINGDFVTAGYDTTLSAGTMTIGGDITQIGTSSYYDDNFACSGTHTVILNGFNNTQKISFDSTSSHFNNLKLTKDKDTGYIFSPDNCWNNLYLDTDVKSVSIVSDLKSLRPMDVYTLYAKVEGINKPNQEVVWQLTGNTDNDTTIDNYGIVTIGEDEKTEKITITATSVADDSKSATLELSIIRPTPVVIGVRINPNVVSAVNGETCQFEAVTYGLYKPAQGVTWSMSGNTSANTSINSDGLLTIAEDETTEQLTVTATSIVDPTKSASVTVDIYQIKIISTVSNVTVTMATGETQIFQAVVTGSNNPNQKVIWTVGGSESTNTVIDENGELTVGEDESAKTIIVRATSAEDPEKYGEFAINITNSDEPQYQVGDTNLDGRITISDVTAIQRHLAELELFTDEQIALADTNGDGIINIIDATHLQKYLAEFDGIVLGKQTE